MADVPPPRPSAAPVGPPPGEPARVANVSWKAAALAGGIAGAVAGVTIAAMVLTLAGRGSVSDPVVLPPVPLDDEYARKSEFKKLRKQLEEPQDGRTLAAIRLDVEAFGKDIAKVRGGPDGAALKLGRGTPDDPAAAVAGILEKCDAVQAVIDDEQADGEKVRGASETLRKADAELMTARARFESLVKNEREALAAARRREMADATLKKQQDAYAALAKLATHAVLPAPPDAGLDEGSQGNLPIDLGAFPVQDLVDPRFSIAVPRDQIAGNRFVARVSRPDAAKPEWFIEYELPAIGLNDEASSTFRPLARLFVEADHLFVQLTDGPSSHRSQALLRRGVLLVDAKQPSSGSLETKPGPAEKPREIRFVKPTQVGKLKVDPFAENRSLTVTAPPGIASRVDDAVVILPNASCEIVARFIGQEVRRRLPNAPGGKDAEVVIQERIRVADLVPGATLFFDVGFTPAEATLSVRQTVDGLNAKQCPPFDELRDKFLDEPAEKRDKASKAWSQKILFHPSNPGMKPGQDPKDVDPKSLDRWFNTPFAGPATMGVALPGHETIRRSLDVFLRHEYAEAAADLKRRRDAGEKNVPEHPPEPRSFDDWYKDLLAVRDAVGWKQTFQDTVRRWWEWFKPEMVKAWDGIAGNAQVVVRKAAEADCRIESITSLAYDEKDVEYPVPLVVFDDPKPAKATPYNDAKL